MTSASSLELIVAWRGSRMPLARFLPLALLLAWAAAAASTTGMGGVTGSQAAAVVLLALGLIAQFRLWDDLADRARDLRAHPGRVLANDEAVAVLTAASGALAAFNMLALGLLRGWAQALAALVLGALVLLWYRVHRGRGLVHAHVLLLKYPAFVVLLAGAPVQGAALLLAAALVYCALCAFELLDDPALNTPAGVRLAGLHAALLAAAPLATGVDAAAGAAAAASACVLAAAWLRWQHTAAAGAMRYLPFPVAALGLIFITTRGMP